MANFAHDILEYLQRNHFTDAESALRSELLGRKSTNGWSSFNDSIGQSTQGHGGGHNENYSREQRTELRDPAFMQIKSYKPNNLTAYMTSEKGMPGTLKDKSDSDTENFRSPPLSSKALSNKKIDSDLKVEDLECYSSKLGTYEECKDANSKRTLYENNQVPVSVIGYANGALGQYKTSSEQRKLQDLTGVSEEMLMYQNGHMQFGNWIDYSPPGDPKLGLSGISGEKTRIEKGLSNNMIEAKGKFYETQGGEILQQDMPEVQYPPRNIPSTEDLKDQIEAVSQVDGDNHASKEGDQNLRLHGKENNFFRHDKKTLGPQIANAMLDVEPNIKSHAKFDQGREEPFRDTVLTHANGEKIAYIQEHFGEKIGYRTAEHSQSNFGSWKEGPLKTAFPFSLHEVFVNKEHLFQSQALEEVVEAGNKGIGQGERKGLTSTNKGLGREGELTRMLNYQGSPQQKKEESPELLVDTGTSNELFPRFSSKVFEVADYSYNVPKESFEVGRRMDSVGPGTKSADMESSVLLEPYFHFPVEQEIKNSGKKLTIGSRQVSNDYLTAQRDSDIYDDGDDLGYIRKPVKNDAWLFPHEKNPTANVQWSSRHGKNPTENAQWSSRHGKNPNQKDSSNGKNEHDNQSFAENLYFSGDQYFPSDNELKDQSENPSGLPMAYNYDGEVIGNVETNSLQIGPEWQGFTKQRNGLNITSDEGNIQRSKANNFYFIDHHELVRSTGLEDTGTNVRRNHIAGITEGLSLYEYKPVKYDRSSSSNNSIDRGQLVKKRQEVEDHQVVRHDFDSWRDHRDVYDSQSGESDPEQRFIKDALKERPNGSDSQNTCNGSLDFGGFLYQSSSAMVDVAEVKVEPEKSFLSNNRNMIVLNGEKYSGHNMIGPDGILIASRRKNNESSPIWSEKNGNLVSEFHTMDSTVSTHFNYENVERMGIKNKKGENLNDLMEDADIERIEDEEAASLRHLTQQMKAQQDQFETFDLQIVHRRNRTGYEEVKDYHAVLNTVIAGRYHVIQNLGSAVFSNVVQVHDLLTGMDVCLKIIKNNKDFFDQSLDEIKLLKFVNKHDPADKYHLLRVYNYFYHCEHLFIVCELLKANLYEFYKFNRESGGEAYFTMPRLQSIAIQCLEALQFLHNLGLIHCDLKPENILMKSYSRCEVKVIDLGSSCFETDNLCSNVQSRSYRAPEVILGLPYDKRIDIWSLGCILSELFLGNVLFQSDSSATLLASIIAILGPIDEDMLVMGCDTHKYFTKNYMLYERNQDTNVIEYLTPKRTSLRNRLTMGDQGFIDFVSFILEINPKKRPTASAALQHPWLSYTYEPISS